MEPKTFPTHNFLTLLFDKKVVATGHSDCFEPRCRSRSEHMQPQLWKGNSQALFCAHCPEIKWDRRGKETTWHNAYKATDDQEIKENTTKSKFTHSLYQKTVLVPSPQDGPMPSQSTLLRQLSPLLNAFHVFQTTWWNFLQILVHPSSSPSGHMLHSSVVQSGW